MLRTLRFDWPLKLTTAAFILALSACGGGGVSEFSDDDVPSRLPGGIDNDGGLIPGSPGGDPVDEEAAMLPSVSAGARQFADPNVLITLRGAVQAKGDATIVATQWTQLDGPTVIIPNANLPETILVSPDVDASSSLIFQLTAVDSEGRINAATTTVIVSPTPATARVIGAVVAEETETVAFQVRLRDAPTGPVQLSYSTRNGTAVAGEDFVAAEGVLDFASGEQLQSISVVLIDADPTEAAESFSLQVSGEIDGETVTNAGTAIILNNPDVVIPPPQNLPPVVTVGDGQTVDERGDVTLMGAATDPDEDALTVAWAQTAGPTVVLSGEDSVSATFTAPVVKVVTELTFSFTATDPSDASASGEVQVTVNPVNEINVTISGRVLLPSPRPGTLSFEAGSLTQDVPVDFDGVFSLQVEADEDLGTSLPIFTYTTDPTAVSGLVYVSANQDLDSLVALSQEGTVDETLVPSLIVSPFSTAVFGLATADGVVPQTEAEYAERVILLDGNEIVQAAVAAMIAPVPANFGVPDIFGEGEVQDSLSLMRNTRALQSALLTIRDSVSSMPALEDQVIDEVVGPIFDVPDVYYGVPNFNTELESPYGGTDVPSRNLLVAGNVLSFAADNTGNYATGFSNQSAAWANTEGVLTVTPTEPQVVESIDFGDGGFRNLTHNELRLERLLSFDRFDLLRVTLDGTVGVFGEPSTFTETAVHRFVKTLVPISQETFPVDLALPLNQYRTFFGGEGPSFTFFTETFRLQGDNTVDPLFTDFTDGTWSVNAQEAISITLPEGDNDQDFTGLVLSPDIAMQIRTDLQDAFEVFTLFGGQRETTVPLWSDVLQFPTNFLRGFDYTFVDKFSVDWMALNADGTGEYFEYDDSNRDGRFGTSEQFRAVLEWQLQADNILVMEYVSNALTSIPPSECGSTVPNCEVTRMSFEIYKAFPDRLLTRNTIEELNRSAVGDFLRDSTEVLVPMIAIDEDPVQVFFDDPVEAGTAR